MKLSTLKLNLMVFAKRIRGNDLESVGCLLKNEAYNTKTQSLIFAKRIKGKKGPRFPLLPQSPHVT